MCDAHPDLAVPPESHFVVPLAPHGRRPRPRRSTPPRSSTACTRASAFDLWELDRAVDRDGVGAVAARGLPGRRAAVSSPSGRERRASRATPTRRRATSCTSRGLAAPVPGGGVRPPGPRRARRGVARSSSSAGPTAIEEAALHWRLRVRRGRRAGRALPAGRYLELRYEDLVADPARQLRHLCAAIELPFSPAMLDPTDAGRRGHPHDRPSRLPPAAGRSRRRRACANWRRELSERGRRPLRAARRRHARRARLRAIRRPGVACRPARGRRPVGALAAPPGAAPGGSRRDERSGRAPRYGRRMSTGGRAEPRRGRLVAAVGPWRAAARLRARPTPTPTSRPGSRSWNRRTPSCAQQLADRSVGRRPGGHR